MLSRLRGILTGALFLGVLSAAFAAGAQEAENEVRQIGLLDYVEMIYDESNGMVTSEANTILQDEQGYIWVGSYGGLSRFNGREFQNMSTLRENAPRTGIRVLFEDSRKRLWIGTNDSGVYMFQDEQFYPITQTAGELPVEAGGLSVRSMTEGADGIIYIGTTSGLLAVDADLQLSVFHDERIDNETVENLMCDRSGAVWGSTGNSNIFVIANGQMQMFLDRDFLGIDLAYGLYQAADGSVYIGTESSYLMRLRLTGESYKKENIKIDFLTLESKETVNDLYQDREGKLWVCTDSGIGYFEEGDTFYKINGLSSNTIMTQVCEDYEGNLWFASSRRGVVKLTRNKFQHIGYEADISEQTVNATALYDSWLYIATDNGLKIMDESWEMVENDLTDALDQIRVRSLMVDTKDRLWISTYKEYGLMCYDNRTQKWTSYTAEEGLAHDQVRMALELADGDIAAATNGGVSIIRDGKVVRSYTEEDGILNEVILCLAQDGEQKLYAGSDGNGIYVIDLETDSVENVTTEDGLQSGVILRMVRDDKIGGFWISNGSSVALWTKEGIRQIKDINAGVGSVFDIKLSGDDIWLLKSFGLICISREDYIAGSDVYSTLTRRDGLTSSITANSWNDFADDGRLFICTGNGVYFFNVEDIHRNTTPPRVCVDSIEVNDVVYYGQQDIEVPSDTQRITITLDLLSYGIEQGGMLEYYLEGFDDAPIEIRYSSANYANYTNLPGGEYVFHLKGYNADGTPSEEVRFRISKQRKPFENLSPYIWLATGALLLVALIVILALYLNRRRILKREHDYKLMTDRTVGTVAKTIDAKDKYTDGHSHRVAEYAVEIGRRYGLSKKELDRLYYGALLHDIGKIGVPDHILNKQGKLTDEEFEAIKRHPSIGGNILSDFESEMPWIPQVARYHHERYDGSGYNERLKGGEIPLFARIVAVADAYDAMHSTRVYRAAVSEDKIRQELEKGKNVQFDERFARIMLEMMDDHFEARY